MSDQIDTPRTDDLLLRLYGTERVEAEKIVNAFARTLERELRHAATLLESRASEVRALREQILEEAAKEAERYLVGPAPASTGALYVPKAIRALKGRQP